MEITTGKVIGSTLTKKAYIEAPEGTTWVSVIECVTVGGMRLSPVVIFTGASLQGQWFPEEPVLRKKFPGYDFDHSLTGWSNTRIANKWLNNVYLPETKPPNGDWRLLILDGHSSHLDDKFMYTAWKNKVELLYLPSHSSHKTQPLDRSVFGPLKTYFRQATMAFGPNLTSALVNKQRFLECYHSSSQQGVSKRNIASGFRNTGIWPFNPSKILDDPEAIIDQNAPSLNPAPPPTTPPDELEEEGLVTFFTPKKGRDILDQLGEAERQHRVVARKAAKALDHALTESASLRLEVVKLQRDIQALQPVKKRKVRNDNPNEKFADIKAIIKAKNASKEVGGGRAKRRRPEPPVDQQVVQEAQQQLIHGLEGVFEAQEG